MGLTSLGEALHRNCSEHCLKMLTKKAALVPASPPAAVLKNKCDRKLAHFQDSRAAEIPPPGQVAATRTVDSPAWRTGKPGSCPADGRQGRDLPSQGSPSQQPAGSPSSRQPGTRILKGSLDFYNGGGFQGRGSHKVILTIVKTIHFTKDLGAGR